MTAGMLAQKQPSFQKCVTAYRSSHPAPKMTGTKRRAEVADRAIDGRRASPSAVKRARQGPVERGRVRMPERVTIRGVGSPSAERTRFPGEGQSAQGQSGPKARPTGVADGQAVNIPPPGAEVEPGVTP